MDKYESLMEFLFAEALKSPDPSTQNAAILAHEWGDKLTADANTLSVNCFPRGVVNHPDRWVRPDKYSFVEHAERNAIYSAARYGLNTSGLTLVAVWASCADCARAIIQSGITHLVRYVAPGNHEHWADSINDADAMMSEAGIKITEITTRFPNAKPLLRGGKLWPTP